MNTYIETQNVKVKTVSAQDKKVKAENKIWKKAEEARFGILPLYLLLVVCLGSIAMAFGTAYEVSQMILVTVPAMITLSFILAVAPMRLIIWAGVVSVAADLLVFVI